MTNQPAQAIAFNILSNEQTATLLLPGSFVPVIQWDSGPFYLSLHTPKGDQRLTRGQFLKQLPKTHFWTDKLAQGLFCPG